MSLTKDKALEILNSWANGPVVSFPLDDEIVICVNQNIKRGETTYSEYTFKYLIKVAYNLKDND